VSRSEAKRLLAGLEGLREAELDFRGVESVGQGFVDDLFRVWTRNHPDTELVPTEMNEAVRFMVERGLPRSQPRPTSVSTRSANRGPIAFQARDIVRHSPWGQRQSQSAATAPPDNLG